MAIYQDTGGPPIDCVSPPKQLIVIGNGFDLACGLKSKFSDWTRSRWNGRFLKALKLILGQGANNESIAAALDFDRLVGDDFQTDNASKSNQLTMTAWDILMYQNKEAFGRLWKDVEEFIHSVLSRAEAIGDIFSIQPDERRSLFHYMNADFKKMFLEDDSIRPAHRLLASRYKDEFLYEILEGANYQDRGGFRPRGREKDEKLLLGILLKELNILEREFARYLNKAVGAASGYAADARRLLSHIRSLEPGGNSTVMSFNYTQPFENEAAVFHVHGTLKGNDGRGNIIIGIDKKGVDESAIGFTKTFRKLYNKPTAVLSQCEGITVAKFYGHSFGTMDQSYIYSIFDTLDLYNRRVRLAFYYSIHNQSKADEIKRDQFSLVTRLIDGYGDSIGSAQGRNLMHKLMLEGRLHIEELDTVDILAHAMNA
ncbi:MAG: bacteriophage abortive infection AbiH family protein [Coriobacteriales bacterium]|jgi:hypothetical protein|nr:bacteriophage abortive infection AbiH family protein [Coriobacteriales bacterium]